MTSPTPARLRCFAGSPCIPPLLQSAICPLPLRRGRGGGRWGGVSSRPDLRYLEAELEDQILAVDLIHLRADVPKAKFVQYRERRTVGRCHAGEDGPLARASSPLDQPLGGFGRVAS